MGPDLFVWQAYEPAVKCDVTATAISVGGRLVVIDPVPLSPFAMKELLEQGRPDLVVCTSANHARAAEWWRREFSLRLAAHADAASELGIETDVQLVDGSMLLELLEICALPGAAAGEIALVQPGRFACLGDALVHLPETGLAVLPDKYCADPKLLRRSLQKLLRYEFSTLTFAHGLPLVSQSRSRLEALLA